MSKKQKENKTEIKRLRISKSDLEKINQKRQELGGISFSEFALKSMLERRFIKNPITKEMVLELVRHGNNLNQIAHKLNQGEALDRIGLKILSDDNEKITAIFDILNNRLSSENDS